MKQTNSNVIETRDLGKRYRSSWALKDCSITVPKGAVSALVGPNGAGKTSLLKLLVSLNRASSGSAMVLGRTPSQGSDYLSDIGYLAQEVPLYNRMNAKAHIRMGQHLNARWDTELATKRLEELGIPLNRQVGKLSGGQRAQVALALALAKKPKLLLLDEPVAALDPLARVDFLTSLANAVADAEGDLTVVMSSHLLADLERVCDHLVILASGRAQLCEDIDQAVALHKLLVGPRRDKVEDERYDIVSETHTTRETTLLVRMKDKSFHDSHWHVHNPDIEEIVLAYMGQGRSIGGVR